MVRERIDVKEYYNIGKKYDYYIWHFLQKNQQKTRLGLYSYFDKEAVYDFVDLPKNNPLQEIVDKIDIPYFESYVDESIDFLMGLGFTGSELYTPRHDENFHYDKEQFYRPVLIGFNKFKPVYSTRYVCYCVEGLIEILLKMNPEIVTNVNWG